jgi:hypothetical protein
MILDLLEKYFIDVHNQKIWLWLDITNVGWSQQKKNGLSKKTIDKLKDYFELEEFGDNEFVSKTILDKYYLQISIIK